jgi:hypothetical protein
MLSLLALVVLDRFLNILVRKEEEEERVLRLIDDGRNADCGFFYL